MRKFVCTILVLLVLLAACSGPAASDPTVYIHTPMCLPSHPQSVLYAVGRRLHRPEDSGGRIMWAF